MLRATRRELTKAYRLNKIFCRDLTAPSCRLIALYCIECGIKALIMTERRVESTENLPTDAQIGHDLMAGLRLLRAPRALFSLMRFEIRTLHDRDPQESVHPRELHQALRYGIPTNMETETAAEITKILQWLEGKI